MMSSTYISRLSSRAILLSVYFAFLSATYAGITCIKSKDSDELAGLARIRISQDKQAAETVKGIQSVGHEQDTAVALKSVDARLHPDDSKQAPTSDINIGSVKCPGSTTSRPYEQTAFTTWTPDQPTKKRKVFGGDEQAGTPDETHSRQAEGTYRENPKLARKTQASIKVDSLPSNIELSEEPRGFQAFGPQLEPTNQPAQNICRTASTVPSSRVVGGNQDFYQKDARTDLLTSSLRTPVSSTAPRKSFRLATETTAAGKIGPPLTDPSKMISGGKFTRAGSHSHRQTLNLGSEEIARPFREKTTSSSPDQAAQTEGSTSAPVNHPEEAGLRSDCSNPGGREMALDTDRSPSPQELSEPKLSFHGLNDNSPSSAHDINSSHSKKLRLSYNAASPNVIEPDLQNHQSSLSNHPVHVLSSESTENQESHKPHDRDKQNIPVHSWPWSKRLSIAFPSSRVDFPPNMTSEEI